MALGLTAVLLPGCNGAQEIGDERTTVTTEDVAQHTEALIGQEITVRSLPAETVGESGFVLETDTATPILVLNATGSVFTLPGRDIPIQATGEVTQLAIADVQTQYGLDLEDELYADYEGQPALIARSLALAPTPEVLYESPTGYFDNQTVAVEGELRKLEAPNAFTLFEEGWVNDVGVLVVGVEQNLTEKGTPLEEGENVTVTGVARPFSAELVQEAGLGWDAQKISEFEARYAERPVIVAEGVYPSAVSPAPGN